jgi:hypothetical protein
MSLKDFVIVAGRGTTVAGTGLLTITNTNIQVGDLAVASFGDAAANVAKIDARCLAGSATFQLRDVAGAAVNAAHPVAYAILKPNSTGFGSA